MKNCIIISLCFLSLVQAFGQYGYESKNLQLPITINLDFAHDRVASLHYDTTATSDNRVAINNIDVQLINSDILLSFDLIKKIKSRKEIYYTIGIKVLSAAVKENDIGIAPEQLYGNVSSQKIPLKNTVFTQFLISNDIDNANIKNLKELTFEVNIYTEEIPYDCQDSIPKLLLKNFSASMFGTLAGLVCIERGITAHNEAHNDYDKYRKQETYEGGQRFLTTAKKNHEKAYDWVGSGSIILLGSAIVAVLRLRKHKLHKKYYEEYCKGKVVNKKDKKVLSLKPSPLPTNTLIAPQGQIGLTLSYHF